MNPDAGRLPISEETPAGNPVREDPRFAEMQHEMDALTAISVEPRQPDWPRVTALGTDILTSLGKDITVAAWLGASLLHTEGARGILDGARILADVCSLYWDGLFPPVKRLRARVAAVEWWQEQVAAWLERKSPEFLPAEVASGYDEEFRRIEEAFAEHAPDSDVNLRGLAGALKRFPAEESGPSPQSPAAPPPQAESDAAESPDAEAGATAAAPAPESRTRAAVPPAAPAPALDAMEAGSGPFASACTRFCLEAADALLLADSANPGSYTLRRAGLWAFLRALPPAEGGRTRLPGPADHILPGLQALLAAGEHEKALAGAEAQVGAAIYWLDLSAVSAQALKGLGASHKVALRALEGECLALIQRLPGILVMSFDDGAPFASAATRDWLGALGGAPAQSDPFADELARVHSLAPEEALETLGALLLVHRSGRRALALYEAVFAVCLRGDLAGPAPYLVERLLALFDKHALDDYDPAAAARALGAAADCLAALLRADPGNAALRRQHEQLLLRLSPLQPRKALP